MIDKPKGRTGPIDVSVGLSPTTPVWPDDPPIDVAVRRTELPGGELETTSRASLSLHSGTHIDAPLHFARNGIAIDAVPFDLLIGPCTVFEHRGDGHLSASDLDAMGFVPRRRVLFKTRNSGALRRGQLDANYLSLLPDALDRLVAAGVELLGVDGFSIGPFGELNVRNHVKFCGAGRVIIEVLDLSDVEPGDYHLMAMPTKFAGAEAAPARVVLFRRDELRCMFGDDE